MKNQITDLRNHLFETIEMLKEGDKRMDIEKAETIAKLASVIVHSAKVEVDYLRTTGAHTGTQFIPDAEPKRMEHKS